MKPLAVHDVLVFCVTDNAMENWGNTEQCGGMNVVSPASYVRVLSIVSAVLPGARQ
jgi:hypothetical protein